MSTTTTNFGITLPEGTDTFNPLTFNNDAFTLVDSLIRTTKNATIGTANHVLSENVNHLTRIDTNTSTFIFIAASDYEATEGFSVDDIQVYAGYSDGSDLKNGAYRAGQAVLCHLNGSILTLFINNVIERSYVGMIIHSTTLDTVDKVKSFYGGNSWAKIEDSFLLGASAKYPAGDSGGEEKHKLTIAEMPKHAHSLYSSPNTGTINALSFNNSVVGNQKFKADGSVASTGGGGSHNNMPPYRVVYIWERVS